MADDTFPQVLEPWPGYADLDADTRAALFRAKFQEAGMRFDQPYAIALAAAVGNYEALQQLRPDADHAEPARAAAGPAHDDAGSWAPN